MDFLEIIRGKGFRFSGGCSHAFFHGLGFSAGNVLSIINLILSIINLILNIINLIFKILIKEIDEKRVGLLASVVNFLLQIVSDGVQFFTGAKVQCIFFDEGVVSSKFRPAEKGLVSGRILELQGFLNKVLRKAKVCSKIR